MRQPLPITPNQENNAFLFLGGLHRSGTSVLHRILRDHPLTSGFSDTGVPQDEGQHLQTVFPAAKVFGGPGRFAFNPHSHLSETSELVSANSRQTLLKEWGAYYDPNKKVLLEKSPPNIIRSRFLQALFPDSKFVFIIRHPVAVSLATQKWSNTSVVELMLHWYVAHKVLLNDLNHLSNYLIMRYEDFVCNPQVYINKICCLVSIENFRPTEKVIDHNKKYLSSWLSRYKQESHHLIEIFPEMVLFFGEFGYSISAPYIFEITNEHFC
jgi:hypothetical protein